jgi:hypothetical protein
MGGQSSEEAAELVATIRGEHVVMKNWFMGPTKEAAALRDEYGPYPGLWKEVLTWPGWKEARKSYLRFIQAKETPSSSSSDINIKQEAADNDDGAPRKRRSRWGVASEAPNENAHNGSSSNNDTSNGSPPQKRRSRWGRDAAPPAAPTMAAPPPMLKPLPGLGLPGMPSNLSPQQQDEFRRHQSRLREINVKLDNLDREASRVDALPRGHRERSPSPPPGT